MDFQEGLKSVVKNHWRKGVGVAFFTLEPIITTTLHKYTQTPSPLEQHAKNMSYAAAGFAMYQTYKFLGHLFGGVNLGSTFGFDTNTMARYATSIGVAAYLTVQHAEYYAFMISNILK